MAKESYHVTPKGIVEGVGFNLAVNLFIIKYIYSHISNRHMDFSGDVYATIFDSMSSNQLYKIFNGEQAYIWTEERRNSICKNIGIDKEYLTPDGALPYKGPKAEGEFIKLKDVTLERKGAMPNDWVRYFYHKYRQEVVKNDVYEFYKKAFSNKKPQFAADLAWMQEGVSQKGKLLENAINHIEGELDRICDMSENELLLEYGKNSPVYKICYRLRHGQVARLKYGFAETIRSLNDIGVDEWSEFQIEQLEVFEKVLEKQLAFIRAAKACRDDGCTIIRL